MSSPSLIASLYTSKPRKGAPAGEKNKSPKQYMYIKQILAWLGFLMFIAQPRHFLGANRTPRWVVGVPDPPTPHTKPVELVGGEMDRQWAVTMLIYNLRHNGFQFEIPAGHRRERENHLQMWYRESSANPPTTFQPSSIKEKVQALSGLGTCPHVLGSASTRFICLA